MGNFQIQRIVFVFAKLNQHCPNTDYNMQNPLFDLDPKEISPGVDNEAGHCVTVSCGRECKLAGQPINCELRCQFEDDGTFYNNADKCEDELPDCEQIFNCPAEDVTCVDPWDYTDFVEGNPMTYPKVRSTVCDLPGLRDLAKKCARTCNLCCEKPEFMCYNDPDWTDWCVEHQNEYCDEEEWRPVMAELCGQTCGLCLERECIDKVSDCETSWTLCKHTDHMDFMKENCAATCGYCNVEEVEETCVDMASNCGVIPHLCDHNIYLEIMHPYCQKTCSRCPPTNSTDCYDSTPSCTHWARKGFCESDFYSAAQKKTYCGKTCGLC
ncbi:hypothetical protein FO519_003785 [Halicephalobus sp. NKZ332]|nr:hypothetical protein FO519_003785 [Halicephalobus sp. NKZ332]